MNTHEHNQIELLAPARDSECGITAINCGADAVYIGAPLFGARSAAGNTVPDIEKLVSHAHLFHAKVFVALNTILRNDEIDQAVSIAHALWNIGADGLIIQDMGLLESDLPPIPLIASTQCDNTTAEKVLFLEKAGFSRAILARELSIDEISVIRQMTTIELESFIHGALCVSYSGRCYMSYAIGGRSGNRGECAQPCRKKYSLADALGNRIAKKTHLLSLADMNRSAHIGAMIDAGISSFKIEGRLKDESYIKSVVAYYRKRIDEEIERRSLSSSSDGHVVNPFDARPEKVFNRTFTGYFIDKKRDKPGAIDTPKWKGEPIGKVVRSDGKSFTL
ncbi:MAG TPA: peptidase U32 family protein, partial [Spirochaetota bacterium]